MLSSLPIDVLRVFIDLPQRDGEDERARYGRLREVLPQDSVHSGVDDRVCFTPRSVAVIVVI